MSCDAASWSCSHGGGSANVFRFGDVLDDNAISKSNTFFSVGEDPKFLQSIR